MESKLIVLQYWILDRIDLMIYLFVRYDLKINGMEEMDQPRFLFENPLTQRNISAYTRYKRFLLPKISIHPYFPFYLLNGIFMGIEISQR